MVSGTDLPPPLKRFREPKEDAIASGNDANLGSAVQIAFPPDRSEIEAEDGDGVGVVVKAEGGALPLTWLVDGVPIPSDPMRREAELPQAMAGFHKLSVIDAQGRADRVSIRLK
jgi:penicillin-binding protein 1C